ncbi:MAG: hypothetical protein PWP65_790 [Clostridia bacterium]|nr:hypothetical protein [Clostridia bacterium]
MRDRGQLLTLAAEIDNRLSDLLNIVQEARTWQKINKDRNPDTFSLRAMGSILHDFYSCIENVFENIAVTLNGGLPKEPNWHKRLLQNMTLDIPKLRPAVISRDLEKKLDEYLRFRHIFRNVYGHLLEWERMEHLVRELDGVASRVTRELAIFKAFLIHLAEKLE